MIVSLLSHDNRKRRRASRSHARKAGHELPIARVASAEVTRHIVALTTYLTNPSPKTLREIAEIEEARHPIVDYLGRAQKAQPRQSASDIDEDHRERVVQVLTRNLLSIDLADVQLELALVAGLSPAGEDPIEHIVLSWREGEEPTPDQIEETLDILLEVAGLARHQAYAVVHGDTDNRHLHIAVNRVDPATGARVQIGERIERPLETLHQAIAIIEHRQSWVPQDHALYRADERGCFDRATNIMVRDSRMRVCSTVGQHARIREQRAEDKRERRISPAARDYERRTGHESLQRRVLAMAPALRDAASWEEVHNALAPEGMTYAPLPAGAVIRCGDRTIAASAAWGGASAEKMTIRLGPYRPPPSDLPVAPFVERIIPAMHKVAEQRRQAQAKREAKDGLNRSIAGARRETTLGFADRVTAAAAEAPEDLNEIRRNASADLEPLRQMLQRLRSRRSRARTRPDDLAREPGDDIVGDDDGEAHALLLGPRALRVPATPDPELIEAGYQVATQKMEVLYRRGPTLMFVDRGDRIDLYQDEDDTIRDALRLAQRKWGKVHACGDARFLRRLVRIAVVEGVEIANPELQPLIEAARLEQDHARTFAGGAASAARPPPMQAVPPAPLHRPDILRDYAPVFGEWIDAFNTRSMPDGLLDAQAAAITANPVHARQLDELDSQQFAFARVMRRAAARRVRARHQALAQDDDLQDMSWPREGLPAMRQSLSDEERAAAGIVLAPAASGSEPANAIEPHDVPLAPRSAIDLDDRYFEIALMRRQRRVADLEAARIDALAARIGPVGEPPRHLARLLLRVAEEGTTASAQPNSSDRQIAAALGEHPRFASMLADARAGDPDTMAKLRRRAEGQGDVLGRVKCDADGKLDFRYRSVTGHDPDARPPRGWLERSFRHLDFARVRLTRRGRFVGLTDKDLLGATHHNYEALLYPEIQARLDLEWRLQRERDVALLARIVCGEVKAEIELRGNLHDFEAGIRSVTGASDAERDHLAAMLRDPEGYVAVRDILRGEPAPVPLHDVVTAAAVLRARAERADPVVQRLLADQLRHDDADLARRLLGTAAADGKPPHDGHTHSSRGIRRGVTARPPSQPGAPSR